MIYANVLDISMKSYTCFWFIKLKSWSNSLFTIFHFVKGIIQECHDLFLLFKKGLKVKHKIFMIYGQLLNVYRVTQENTYISPEKGGKWATHYDLLICKCFLRFLLFFPFKESLSKDRRCCLLTDSKAPWSKLRFMTLGYVNKIDLIWLEMWHMSRFPFMFLWSQSHGDRNIYHANNNLIINCLWH